MKTAKYTVSYLILIQLFLGFIFPINIVYQNRMDYSLVKDNAHNINAVLEQISKKIKAEQLEDYIIILGDSVSYSGPGESEQSVGVCLEQIASQAEPEINVFNLALPAMQVGDIYTMLLKLKQFNISTENLIINISYAGFVERNPNPPIIFWLSQDLQQLDKNSFMHVLPQLQANGHYTDTNIWHRIQSFLKNRVYPTISVLRYKDYMIREISLGYKKIRGIDIPDDTLGDTRPWYMKDQLEAYLERPENSRAFSDTPFDMSINNPQVYFLEKIEEFQRGKNTLVFLIAINDELMKGKVTQPGYVENLGRIDSYFEHSPFNYLNLQGQIDQKHFTDHVHLTSEGYNHLAEILYDNFF